MKHSRFFYCTLFFQCLLKLNPEYEHNYHSCYSMNPQAMFLSKVVFITQFLQHCYINSLVRYYSDKT